MRQAVFKSFMYHLQQSCKIGVTIIPILQMDSLRSRKVKVLIQVPHLVSGKAEIAARLLVTLPDRFLQAG